MRHLFIFFFLSCCTIIHSATTIVSWNPPTDFFRDTYKDSKTFNAEEGDVLSCRYYGSIHSTCELTIYLTIKGIRKEIVNFSTSSSLSNSFDKTFTCQFDENGEYKIEYEYYNYRGGAGYSLNIDVTLNDFVKTTSLSLDTASIMLNVGEDYKISPHILPEYASNKEISWTSSNETIATVSPEGVVRGNHSGFAIISAKTASGGYEAKCKVAIRNLSEHHDHIDLGLPSGTLWATTNIGASIPEKEGYNYAWGELFPSISSSSVTDNYSVTKYNTNDSLTELEPEDDVATIMWGGDWKTPSVNDFQELINNCSMSFPGTTNGYNLVKFTAKNGNYILLPAWRHGDFYYWTSSIYMVPPGTADQFVFANCYFAQFSTNCNRIQHSGRNRAYPIRPVTKIIKVNELSIIPSLDINVGENYQIDVNIEPSNATEPAVIWSSSDESVAKITPSGILEALKSGITNINVSTTDGSEITATCVVSVHNPVKSVNIDKSNVSMHVCESVTLQSICTPIDADDTSITWTSSNDSIVSVYNGIITAKEVGTAVVTASTVNGKSASCNVTVETTYANSITINKTSLSLISGEEDTLSTTILPSYTTNKGIIWKSSDEKVAIVSNLGIVKALSTGVAKITVTTTDGSGISASCDVTVSTPVLSIYLNKSSETLKVGEYTILQATCLPSNADNTTILWSSSNTSVANVKDGIVTALTIGESTIIATSINGKEAQCVIRVIETPISTITLDITELAMEVGNEHTLIATVLPETATNKSVRWNSSNENVAAVTNGNVIAIAPGESIITVSSCDGTNITTTCHVSVDKMNQIITWEQSLDCVQFGGQLIELTAKSSSGLKIKYKSIDESVASIFDLEDIVYLNPGNFGKTSIIASQEGNNEFYPAEDYSKEVEVVNSFSNSSKTLVAYYSQSPLIDGIVAELANQIVGISGSVKTIKIEPQNNRINDASLKQEVRDSVMNVINSNPTQIESYPAIKPVLVEINDFDVVIMVYPLWNNTMAAPMQTFKMTYEQSLKNKEIGYIEYDETNNSGTSSNSKILRICISDIETTSELIKEWLNNNSTGINVVRSKGNVDTVGIYDLQGRKLQKVPNDGIYIINGHKIVINNGKVNGKSVE